MAEGDYTVTYPSGTTTFDKYDNIIATQVNPPRPLQKINDNYSVYALRPEDMAKFEQDYQTGLSMGQDKPWALSEDQIPVRRQGPNQWAYDITPQTTGGSTFNDATGQWMHYPTEQGGLFGLGDIWGSLAGTALVLGAGFGLGALAPGAAAALPAGVSAAEAAGLAGEGALFGAAGPAAAAGAGAAGAAGAAGVAGAAGAAGAGAAAAGGGLAGTLAGIAPYAPLIATGVGAVGNVIGAGIQAGAAKDAARTQADAAHEANLLLQQQYEQQRADLAPYRAAGVQALGGLTNLVNQPLTYGPYQAQAPLDPSQYAFTDTFDPNQYAFNDTFDPNQYAFNDTFDPNQYAFNDTFDPNQYAFTPPSGQEVLNQDPGYQFRVQQGQLALDRQAAGKGQLLSGGQLKGAARFSQDLASQEYGAAYGRGLTQNQLRYERDVAGDVRARALNEMNYGRGVAQDVRARALNEMNYGRGVAQDVRARALNEMNYGRGVAQDVRARALNEMNYGRAQTANEQREQRGAAEYDRNYNVMTGLRGIRYNELAGLAGTGQTSTAQLGQQGAQTAANVAQNTTSAGAAQAAGQVGAASAINQGISGVSNAANNYLNYQMLQSFLQQRK